MALRTAFVFPPTDDVHVHGRQGSDRGLGSRQASDKELKELFPPPPTSSSSNRGGGIADPQRLQSILISAGMAGFYAALEGEGVDDLQTLASLSLAELQHDVGITGFGTCRKLQLLASRASAAGLSADVSGMRGFLGSDDVRLGQYEGALLHAGVDCLAVLCSCTEDEMRHELGITKIGHRRRLRLRLDSLLSSPSLSLPPSEQFERRTSTGGSFLPP
eukprot:Hpha_TRINITY_DN17089_c0_g1::TRINITY_DN17089_c0_g1_i1::g.166981::m.166981